MSQQLINKLQDPQLLTQQAFINGQWVDAKDNTTFDVIDPATERVLAKVADLGAAQTAQAIDSAYAAMCEWRSKTPKHRSEVLEKWFALIVANTEDLAIIMSAENGKTLTESRGEVAYSASFLKWFAEEGKRVYGDIVPTAQTDRRGIVVKQPIGVVAAITPWNFPSAMITRKVAPALAVGCAVVLKPAAETPLSALALAELASRAGLPAGLLNIVTGEDAVAIGAELTSNLIVKKLTFTGSTPVGKILMAQCAATVKRTSMELGGNAPIIIFDDADLDLVMPGIINAKFRNSGQTCISANRLIVQEGIYAEFVKRLKAATENFSFGAFTENTSTHGPLITAKAVTGIDQKVKEAVAQGANVVCGGEITKGAGYFYPPTILTNLNDSMTIFKDEIFGPVAAIYKFSTQAQAVKMANDTQFGLAAYFYTESMRRSWSVSEALEYGMVGVNETAISAEMVPFGGVKESGQGREGSKYGLDDYLEIKYICMGALNEKSA
ncbi:MAG: succinate-semialdehyde dehydrogenase/glutarate-semialdehyde dehydrogenase [Oceanospirillaceae bacterium]|jgi:succinate-semialdehyde dehydrogenase/glutarate-semialdehyde dehydrogenase